ncbi:ATP-binding protein [Marinibaculum pumilum]|uniref:histidine kinase n=1 Tax=Marinibaculum pumilum TaxID=1766165 RepID=A0ABV7L153_9PROT
MSDDRVPIIEDRHSAGGGHSLPPWLVLIVDDDDSVHQATRFALDDFRFENRGLHILSAYSAEEAREVISDHADAAVILLDVVMESEHVGLDLVRWIRDELSNNRVRIVLRTGQPGFAPELQVVRDYDINDYKQKSEMTAARLVTTVYSALRSFRDIVRLEQQADRLTRALKTAEDASRAKTDFITHMSHEFRTPLNSIIGLSEVIATEMLGPVATTKYKEYAWDIVTSGRRLQILVESVLDLAEDGDRQSMHIQTFDLHELVSEFFAQESREIPLMREREDAEQNGTVASSGLMLRADRHAVLTMLKHLVSNALNHNPSSCRVRVTARQLQDGRLVLSVVDDGVGIDPAVMKRLGEPFNLQSNPYVSGRGGLGLGLLATKALIERHGGRMVVESERGKGTTVRLLFPAEGPPGQKDGSGRRQ